MNRNNFLQCSCLIEQGIKWKKKEDSLLLTYTETLLAWWEEEQGEKIHFIQWVFGMLKKGLTEISQEQITLLKVSTPFFDNL